METSDILTSIKKRKSRLKNANTLNVKKRKARTEDSESVHTKGSEDVESVDQKTTDHHPEGDFSSDEDSPDRKEGVEQEHEEQQHLSGHVTHGFHLVKGKMGHGMEDFLVAKNKTVNGHSLGLYAIFDGHSGRDVAKYLQSHLFDNILNEPDFWTNPERAVKRAYKDTDDDILENVVGSRGGSTAVTSILINEEKLIVANVGDSRAILSRNGEVKQITEDHEPQKEKKLVESRGGFISKKPGNVPRVDGQLAMTRAFGDGKLKDHISSEPDVFIETIDLDTDFIILASDGLWKVVSNEEACACISDLTDAQEASEQLIKESLLRGSHDDISCIVVMFD